ncbi:MAG: S1 RNA-binding domain-containing protein [Candidatus Pacearchaeota archaeon]|nr:S1 RNA-binding domain-containing protein [Candidatus Pacearchaeota archaeon]
MEKEFPEPNEVVLATVEKIVGTSVFVRLKDYPHEGVIVFSEIAPGRIRNIRDYVNIGQKIVVKVLRVDKAKKHIDLSLRRVTPQERKNVLELEKKEKELSIILELVIKDKDKREKVANGIKEIGVLEFFKEIFKREVNVLRMLKELGLEEEEAKEFVKKLKEKIKTKKVSLKAKFGLRCFEPNGIERIKKVLDIDGKIIYAGAPFFILSVENSDYKSAAKKIEFLLEEIKKRAEKEKCEFILEK